MKITDAVGNADPVGQIKEFLDSKTKEVFLPREIADRVGFRPKRTRDLLDYLPNSYWVRPAGAKKHKLYGCPAALKEFDRLKRLSQQARGGL